MRYQRYASFVALLRTNQDAPMAHAQAGIPNARSLALALKRLHLQMIMTRTDPLVAIISI